MQQVCRESLMLRACCWAVRGEFDAEAFVGECKKSLLRHLLGNARRV